MPTASRTAMLAPAPGAPCGNFCAARLIHVGNPSFYFHVTVHIAQATACVLSHVPHVSCKLSTQNLPPTGIVLESTSLRELLVGTGRNDHSYGASYVPSGLIWSIDRVIKQCASLAFIIGTHLAMYTASIPHKLLVSIR